MTEPTANQLRHLYYALATDDALAVAALAAASGIPRAAVPDAVERLRALGALVGGDARTGFRRVLPPRMDERAVAALLTGELGRTLVVHGVVATTMEVARVLAGEGSRHGTVVLAEGQYAGRGRRGRAWASPPRLGIYMSILLERGRLPDSLTPLSLLAGVAVAEACAPAAGVPVGVKWPNDLVCENAKLGGIIIEALHELRAVIIGIGVNVFHCPFDFPADLPYAATSLAAVGGRDLERNALAAAVLDALDTWLKTWRDYGPSRVIAAWKERNVTLGLPVRFAGSGVAGLAVDVNDDGALLVEDAQGCRHAVYAGDILTDENP